MRPDHTLRLLLQRTLRRMFGLEWLVGTFGGGTVMVLHRLGGRRIGTAGPFETEGEGFQCEFIYRECKIESETEI